MKVTVNERKYIWKIHMEKLMNVENALGDCVEHPEVEVPLKMITSEEIELALRDMKNGKAGGPTGVVVEMLKTGGDGCLKSLAKIFNEVLFKNLLPEDSSLSSLAPIYKGKVDPLNINSYRGIKILEHAFKLYERVLDKRLREIVEIDTMQYGFMSDKGSADAVFILRRLAEKYQSKVKNLHYLFVDFEKAFDRVLRRVI